MANNDLEILNAKLIENNTALLKLKRLIPLGTLTMTICSFILPFLTVRSGRMIDLVSYPIAVIWSAITLFGVYIWGYKKATNKRKNEIKKLNKEITLLKNQLINN